MPSGSTGAQSSAVHVPLGASRPPSPPRPTRALACPRNPAGSRPAAAGNGSEPKMLLCAPCDGAAFLQTGHLRPGPADEDAVICDCCGALLPDADAIDQHLRLHMPGPTTSPPSRSLPRPTLHTRTSAGCAGRGTRRRGASSTTGTATTRPSTTSSLDYPCHLFCPLFNCTRAFQNELGGTPPAKTGLGGPPPE